MAKAQSRLPADLQPWSDARQRHRLSHVHIQMARELGMNPKKLGGLDNHHQERWKQPLPDFIARLYCKRFGVETPAVVRTIEEVAAARLRKKQERKARKAERIRLDADPESAVPDS